VGGHFPFRIGACGAQGPKRFRQLAGEQAQNLKFELLIPHSVTAQVIMVDRTRRHVVDLPACHVTVWHFTVVEHDPLLRYLHLEVNAFKMTRGL
jgi:hypothetical protein